MIVYDRLWDTMKKQNITQYQLIKSYHVSKGQLDRIKHNRNVQMHTIDMLCKILDCNIEDIAEYRKGDLGNQSF